MLFKLYEINKKLHHNKRLFWIYKLFSMIVRDNLFDK